MQVHTGRLVVAMELQSRSESDRCLIVTGCHRTMAEHGCVLTFASFQRMSRPFARRMAAHR